MIRTIVALVLLAGVPVTAQERNLEAGFQLALVSLDELDATNVGFGGRFAVRPLSLLALEAELNIFPGDLPGENPITSSRTEGLFGVRIGPRYETFGLFGKFRPGFVHFGEAPGPVVCLAIYPPPLGCLLAEGQTVFALDVGGGVEVFPSASTLIRVDLSSLFLRYPGPAFTRVGEAIENDGFIRGNWRLSFGAAIRF